MASTGDDFRPRSRHGDYELGELISQGARTTTYLAEQISVRRPVVLERLKEDAVSDPEAVTHFLDDVRAKAAVDHPGIGSVYEAVREEGAVFFSRELLAGQTFEALHEDQAGFSPARIATFLRQIANAVVYLEERGVATLPLEPRHFVLGDHEVVRMVNLAVAEETGVPVAGHDRHLIAELLLDLLERGQPGATRTTTLLNMMAELDGTALTWTQVAHTARKLEKDLSEGARRASQAILPDRSPERGARGMGSKAVLALGAGALAVALFVAGSLLFKKRDKPPASRDLDTMVRLPRGTYRNHAGKEIDLRAWWLDAHEVTIAEYAAFLGALAGLPEGKRTAYDHPDQPPIKTDHVPDDWEALLSAARSGTTFEGLPIDLNHPVIRVDWWDAHAYAAWRGGRLPTQEELFAASQDAAALAPAAWGAVDGASDDVTPRDIHGLAGNVSEWVRDPATNPAFPMNPKQPVVCGGSYLHPRNGAKARQWLPSRELRRPDVGFRIARDSAP